MEAHGTSKVNPQPDGEVQSTGRYVSTEEFVSLQKHVLELVNTVRNLTCLVKELQAGDKRCGSVNHTYESSEWSEVSIPGISCDSSDDDSIVGYKGEEIKIKHIQSKDSDVYWD